MKKLQELKQKYHKDDGDRAAKIEGNDHKDVVMKLCSDNGYPLPSFFWLPPIRNNLSAGLQIFQVGKFYFMDLQLVNFPANCDRKCKQPNFFLQPGLLSR